MNNGTTLCQIDRYKDRQIGMKGLEVLLKIERYLDRLMDRIDGNAHMYIDIFIHRSKDYIWITRYTNT